MTHVCRYWRESALGYPFMWSPVVFEPEDVKNQSSLPYQCLQRSQGAPLDVQINLHDEPVDVHLWDMLATRCSRLRKFHVTDLIDTEQLKRFRYEAPLLQSLDIDISFELRDRRSDGEDIPDELPELFAGTTPSLRHLSLSFFSRFSTNRFANLASLRLSHQLYRTEGDISHLLALLVASPNLEELSLTDVALASAQDGASPTLSPTDTPCIPMHRLRRLALVACPAALVSTLLWRLELGDGVGIVLRDWTPADRPLELLLPPVSAARLRALDALTGLALTYDSAEAHAWGRHGALRLAFDHDLDVAERIAPGLRAALPLGALRELRLAGIELHGADFWRATFRALPSLARLVLWLPPTEPAKWLAALAAEQPAAATRAYPAPVLDELCVFPPFPEVWGTLAALVRARKEDGHPVRVVRVMCEEGTRDAAIRKAFEGWKASARCLEAFVQDVKFEVVSQYRHVDVPEEFWTFFRTH